MVSLTQANGETLELPSIPSRIVSVVPSITENLFFFGVTPVGRTQFCIEPKPYVESIPSVGGPKSLKVKKILDCQPDLVIANQEENLKDEIQELEKKGIPVWVTYPCTVEETFHMMEEMKGLVPKPEKVDSWLSCCKVEWGKAKEQEFLRQPRILTLIWKNPWIGVAAGTYIHDLVTLSGGKNVLAKEVSRYPELDEARLLSLEPDILLFPTEPYSFKAQDLAYLKGKFQAQGKTVRMEEICGEDVCWPGPRMIQAFRVLSRVISRES